MIESTCCLCDIDVPLANYGRYPPICQRCVRRLERSSLRAFAKRADLAPLTWKLVMVGA